MKPISEKTKDIINNEYRSNVSNRKITKDLKISKSTVRRYRKKKFSVH